MKRLASLLLVMLTLSTALHAGNCIPANNNNSPFSISLELTTKYMWRAIEYGDAPTSYALINYKRKGFSAYAEGVYAFNGSHSEVDLDMAYNYKWFTVGVNDYYYPTSAGEKKHYFKLSSCKAGHYIEGAVTIASD